MCTGAFPQAPAAALLPYLKLGWYLHPLRPRAKEPLTNHGLNDASNDSPQVLAWSRRYPGCNWGLNVGRSGVFVVDLDGEEGNRSWEDCVARDGVIETLASLTGSGGLHLFFSDPEGVGRNTVRRVGPGIDTRGHAGYVVLPPSVHPSGVEYRWINWPTEPALLPDWLVDACRPPAARSGGPTPVGQPDGSTPTAWGAACMRGILGRLANAERGTRHQLTLWAAIRAGELYALGHVPERARAEVLMVAQELRQDEMFAAARDVRDGWQYGLSSVPSNHSSQEGRRR
jgi:Bifunctional DNA primase/polymerase, N-terminal